MVDELQSAAELDAFYAAEDPWSYEIEVDDKRRVEALLATLPRLDYYNVLDVGCGNGFLTARLPGKRIVGIDISSKAVEWAKIRAERVNKDIDFRCGSILDLEQVVGASQFDLIVITGVLYKQYIGKSASFIKISIDKLLAPGGHLALVHIAEWYNIGFAYKLIERQIYPYRSFHHLLEVYKK